MCVKMQDTENENNTNMASALTWNCELIILIYIYHDPELPYKYLEEPV